MESSSTPCPVAKWSAADPDWPAVISGSTETSYATLDALALHAEEFLQGRGIVTGDRIGIIGPATPELLAVIWSCIRIGILVCPISDRFPPDLLGALETSLGLKNCFSIESLRNELSPPNFGKHNRAHVTDLPFDRMATITLTSGSSGVPTGVVHTVGNHYFSAIGSATNIPVNRQSRWALSIPHYHIGGLSILVRCFLEGATVVIPDSSALAEEIERSGITHVSLVETQLMRLLESRKPSPARLQAVLVGGGPVSTDLVRKGRELGYPIYKTYGLTEACSQVATTQTGSNMGELDTSGPVLPYRKVLVSSDGEILVGGRTLGQRLVNGEITALAEEDGYYRTGDIGSLDDRGLLAVTGRRDNMFISGGENIHPGQIERIMCHQEGVVAALVVPIPSSEFGFRPYAFVQIEKDFILDEVITAVRNALRELLPGFYTPDTFVAWSDRGDDRGIKVDRAYWQRIAEQDTTSAPE